MNPDESSNDLPESEIAIIMPPSIRLARVLLWVVYRGWFLLWVFGFLEALIWDVNAKLYFIDILYNALHLNENLVAWISFWMLPSFFCAFLLKVVDNKKRWSRFSSIGVFILAGFAFGYETVMRWMHDQTLSIGTIFLAVLFLVGAASLFTASAREWFTPTKEEDAGSLVQTKIFFASGIHLPFHRLPLLDALYTRYDFILPTETKI